MAADWTAEYYVANESECKLLLENPVFVQNIPSLDSAMTDDLKDGQLVRFRGMIQDMYDQEYYCKEYTVVNTETGQSVTRNGMYKDSVQYSTDSKEIFDADSSGNKLSERQTCVVISTPGLNDWSRDRKNSCNEKLQSPSSGESTKRQFSEGSEPMDCSEPRKKKGKTDDENEDCNEKENSTLSREHFMNFPIPIEGGKACLVKIYDDKMPYKLNRIVEIVGFLSLDPTLSQIQKNEMENELELKTHNPPASIVPRLHAIKIFDDIDVSAVPSWISDKIENARADLRMVLGQLLFGDTLAADYLICHLISAIYTRRDHLCLGNFPINITNFPASKYKNFPKDLYKIIANLVPKSHYINLSLESLNDSSFIPKKDYDCNRLTSGILQLSKNTHLVVDETEMTSGRLSAMGKKNYEAIAEMLFTQKVSYDFKFFKMEHETDIPVLVLSEVKSFVPCPTQIKLRIDSESEKVYPQVLEAAEQFLRDEERLSNIRDYLSAARAAKFDFGDEMTELIQVDFVKLRQTEVNFGPDNLHLLMVLARLLSISRGKNVLTPEIWQETVALEVERMRRLPNHK